MELQCKSRARLEPKASVPHR